MFNVDLAEYLARVNVKSSSDSDLISDAYILILSSSTENVPSNMWNECETNYISWTVIVAAQSFTDLNSTMRLSPCVASLT